MQEQFRFLLPVLYSGNLVVGVQAVLARDVWDLWGLLHGPFFGAVHP